MISVMTLSHEISIDIISIITQSKLENLAD